MNLPHNVVRHVFATIALIFRCMAYVPHRFPNNGNDRRLTEGQLLRRASVKRKPCGSPTKNGCANLAPLRFCRYFTDNDTGLVTKSPSSSTFSATEVLPRAFTAEITKASELKLGWRFALHRFQ